MESFLEVALRAVLGVASLIILVRLNGLRSFSKMSSFDFAITVAMGSILAAMVTTLGTSVWIFLAAFAMLFVVQATISIARQKFSVVGSLVDNAPMLIMKDGKPLEANLAKAKITVADLHAKLREANAFNLAHVHAVVLESTGDVSVLHGEETGHVISVPVMDGVSN